MDVDDLVIGSGLAALGAVLGALRDRGRRVLVLAGPGTERMDYYDRPGGTPLARLGLGGLGEHWHGVIPLSRRPGRELAPSAARAQLLDHFYPRARLSGRLGTDALFVPWWPIRPGRTLARLARREGPSLTLRHEAADLVGQDGGEAWVQAGGRRWTARRVWVAAGALHTADLLSRSFGSAVRNPFLSDHVICYLGRLPGPERPEVRIGAAGVVHGFWRAAACSGAIYTLRPALFDFARLDHGIQRRAVFGAPTGHVLRKLLRRASPGVLAEALFNRVGLPSRARLYSAFAQVRVPDALDWADHGTRVRARAGAIREATDAARLAQPFAGLEASRRPELYLPGIHLHGSLDLAALHAAGIDREDSAVRVVDASTLADIGGEHHSFDMLARAFERSRRAGVAG